MLSTGERAYGNADHPPSLFGSELSQATTAKQRTTASNAASILSLFVYSRLQKRGCVIRIPVSAFTSTDQHTVRPVLSDHPEQPASLNPVQSCPVARNSQLAVPELALFSADSCQ
jgi:hypothetical protein